MSTFKLLLMFFCFSLSVQMYAANFEDYAFFSGMTDDFGEYFHMNMGTGTNMWYYQDNATYGGDNYSLERKMYPAIPNVFN